MAGTRHPQAGMTLIELVIATAIGALVLAGMHSVVSLGLRAQAEGGQANELLYQGQFALERMVTTARSISSTNALTTPIIAGTTGTWFAPAMYCCNSSCNGGVSNSQLIETTTAYHAANGCTATTVIASNVNAFSAQLPPGAGLFDRPAGVLSLTLTHSATAQAVTVTTSVRLGGGTK